MTTVAQQRDIPDEVVALGGLDRVDYVDLFTARVPGARAWTPESVAGVVWPPLSLIHRQALPGLLRNADRRFHATAELGT